MLSHRHLIRWMTLEVEHMFVAIICALFISSLYAFPCDDSYMADHLRTGNYDSFYQHLNQCEPDISGPYRTISKAVLLDNPEYLIAVIDKSINTNLLLAMKYASHYPNCKTFELICDRYSSHEQFPDFLQITFVQAMLQLALYHLRTFIQYGVDIQAPSNILPAILENQRHIPLLLENGLNLEVPVNDHENVFIATVQRRRDFYTVRNLLDSGINLAANPAAISEKEEEVACRLIGTGAIDLSSIFTDNGSLLRQAVYFNLIRAVRAILETGYDINTTYTDNSTSLHTAVQYDMPDMIDLLLEAGADPSRRDCSGKTPYMMALSLKHTECIKRLASTLSASMKRKFC